MEILKFENSPRPARKKSSSSKIVLGFASIAAVAMLGSTLAASITLNSNAAVEFGQGVAITDACDSSITVTPITSFVNGDPTGNFQLDSITVTNVDADGVEQDPELACDGKTFTVKAYTADGTTPEATYIFDWQTDGGTELGGVFVLDVGSTSGTFNIDTKINISETDIQKLTLETS
jgi:hypothetical protein